MYYAQHNNECQILNYVGRDRKKKILLKKWKGGIPVAPVYAVYSAY